MSEISLTITRLAEILGGRIIGIDPGAAVTGLAIDSRTLAAGEVFFAIRGDQADGHGYVNAAAERGARAAVVDTLPDPPVPLPLIAVANTRDALLRFAAWRINDWQGRIVGITGSSGKTTTKEFIATLLGARYSVFRTPGNYNNTLGVPLSLFHLENRHEVAVVEMGMSTPGEIASICTAVPPDVAVVLNVGSVHQEFFPDRAALAAAKAEIVTGMKAAGTLVYNLDDPYVRDMRRLHPKPSLSFGESDDADIRLSGWEITASGQVEGILEWAGYSRTVTLPTMAGHYLMDLAAAIGAAHALGLTPEEVSSRLTGLRPYNMRGEIHHLPDDMILLDDSYNSNPEAMRGVLTALSRWKNRPETILVAGEMRELGAESVACHIEIGHLAAQTGCRRVIGVAGNAIHLVRAASDDGVEGSFHPSAEDALAAVQAALRPGCLLVIKGSRGVGLDRLVRALIPSRVNGGGATS